MVKRNVLWAQETRPLCSHPSEGTRPHRAHTSAPAVAKLSTEPSCGTSALWFCTYTWQRVIYTNTDYCTAHLKAMWCYVNHTSTSKATLNKNRQMSSQRTLLEARKPFSRAEPVLGGTTWLDRGELFPEGLISRAFSVILRDLCYLLLEVVVTLRAWGWGQRVEPDSLILNLSGILINIIGQRTISKMSHCECFLPSNNPG